MSLTGTNIREVLCLRYAGRSLQTIDNRSMLCAGVCVFPPLQAAAGSPLTAFARYRCMDVTAQPIPGLASSRVVRPGWYCGPLLEQVLQRVAMLHFNEGVPLLQTGAGIIERGILPYVAAELARLRYVEGYVTGQARLKKLRLLPGRSALGARRILLRFQARHLEPCQGSITVVRIRNHGIHYYHNRQAHTWPNARWEQ